jgi:hypothetical protein
MLLTKPRCPKVLAPELLELVSLMLVHRFHSEEWFAYLKSKVPLPPGGFDMIRKLATGQALVFADSQRLMPASELTSTPLLVSVRARFTQDLGASVTNSGCPRMTQHTFTYEVPATQDLGVSVTKSGCPRPPGTRITTVATKNLSAATVATVVASATSTRITTSVATKNRSRDKTGSVDIHHRVTTASAQPAAKIQSTSMSKEEEWLSQIVNSLRNKGGSPVEISGLSNPAQGGVPRPAGVAKNIKLHDLISTHSQCGLVVTKRGKSLLVTLV